MSPSTKWPPADWDAAMRSQMKELFQAVTRAGALGAGLGGSETERQRLALSIGQLRPGVAPPPNLQQMHLELLRITRDAALQAQAAVSRAAAAPEDPRHGPGV